MKYLSISSSDTNEIGKKLAGEFVSGRTMFLLNGPMGAGKTTLIRSMVKKINGFSVTSSSYSIVNHYPGSPNILHADFYRTGWSEELFETEIAPIFLNKTVLFLEWVKPRNIYMECPTYCIDITVTEDLQRIIKVKPATWKLD